MKQREEQSQLKNLFEQGLYDKALKVLNKSTLKEDKENHLLYLLQKGKLYFAKELYFEASLIFLEASELMDKLYTKKIREILLAGVMNDNSKSYRGQIYERSLLFYYQAMSHLKIYRRGKYNRSKKKMVEDKEVEYLEEQVLSSSQKREQLFKARAAVVAWDTFYKELQRSNLKSAFKHDLFAKILAAQIHELVNTRSDGQISLQLYKDATKILKDLGPSLEAFNTTYEKYHKEIWEKGKPKKEFINLTETYKHLESYLMAKTLQMTKKYRSYEFKKMKRSFAKNKQALEIYNGLGKKKIIIENRTIAPLLAEDFSYNLRSAIDSVESPTAKAFIQGVGVPILTYFAMGPLGLGSVSQSGNTRLYVRHGVGEAMVSEAGIEFEMPVIKKQKDPHFSKLLIYKKTKDLDPKKTKPIGSHELQLVGPLSDMAYMMNKEAISNSFEARGLRIAIKHVIAIIAAYKTYQSVQETSGELFAKPAAFAQYLASAKGIKASERADTRQWSTLPSEVLITEIDLPKGEYVLYLSDETQKQTRKLGQVLIEDNDEELISFISN